MNNKPWMPLHVADYLRDTRRLTAAEHGAYLLLIMEYWTVGNLPTDDASLARIACMLPSEWKKAKATIAAFFTSEWRHKRIDKELARAAEISSKRRASAVQRYCKPGAIAEQVQSESTANAELLDTHARVSCSSFLSSSSDTPLEGKEDSEEQACGKFAEFWNNYPHKVGKKDAAKAFAKALKTTDYPTIINALAAYAAKTDDRPWCNPATWLNQGRWDDQPAPQVKSDATTAKPDGIMEHLAKHTERLLSRGDYSVSSTPDWLLPDRRGERS